MKSKEQLYYPMADIYLYEYPGCCGIEVASGFYLDRQNAYDDSWRSGAVPLNKVYEKALEEISRRRNCRHIQLSFVTKYKNKDFGISGEQLPGFKELLLKKKWMLIDEFVNPNHGNKVAVFGKTFHKKRYTSTIY